MKTINTLSSSDIKTYNSNFEIFTSEGCISLYYDQFRDEDYHPIHEHDAREVLASKGFEGDAQDEIITRMHIHGWIISDDCVWMYKVNTYEAYRMDEQGVRWMTHAPSDTLYYKCEIEECMDIPLPEGFRFDEEDETFWKGNVNYELVNENDGSVSLVSAEGIVSWFDKAGHLLCKYDNPLHE